MVTYRVELIRSLSTVADMNEMKSLQGRIKQLTVIETLPLEVETAYQGFLIAEERERLKQERSQSREQQPVRRY